MLNDIVIGQYYPSRSIIHRLDPRTKLLITFAYVVMLFTINQPTGYLLAALFTAVAALGAQIPGSLMLRSLRPVLWLLVITVTLHAFLTKGIDAVTLVRLGPVTITDVGLKTGAMLGFRLGLLVLTSSLMSLTTSPVELTDGLEHLMRPLERLGLPSHEFAMMMTIALRFIPTLMEEAQVIMRAQMARGADFSSGNVWQRARALVPILVPFFVSAFRRADDLALAMEARCYQGGSGRSRYKVLRFGTADAGAWAVMILLAVGIFWVQKQGV